MRWGIQLLRRGWAALIFAGLVAGLAAGLVACGGGSDPATEPTPPIAAPLPPPVAPAPPTLTAQPTDAQVTAGGEARFAVAATSTGTGAITYQWQRSADGNIWTAIAGATSGAYTLAAPTLADNGSQFRVVVTSNSGSASTSATSTAATLRVAAAVAPAAITVQPAPQTVVAGAVASFAVTATGTSVAYRWQGSSDGTAWTDFAGASAATLQLPATTLGQNGLQVRVVVNNSAGSVTSTAVLLMVTPAPAAPAFSLQPLAASVTAPANATFTASAAGTPAPTYQWQRSSDAGATWAAIAGATAASYTTPALSLADSGLRLRVVASNSAGTATSDAATLTVSAAAVAPIITTQPADVSVAAGQTASWNVAANGTPTPSFQWQLSTDGGASFANINGATGSSYSLAMVAADNDRRVRVVVTNTQGTVTSRAAVLSVAAPVSSLVGRGWAAPLRIDNGTQLLGTFHTAPVLSAIDDQGRVLSIYTVFDLTTSGFSAWAVRSRPGDATTAPGFEPPVRIGSDGNSARNARMGLHMSPNGNALVTWTRGVPCPSDTTRTCLRPYAARFLSGTGATGAWEPQQLVADRDVPGPTIGRINDAGDAVIQLSIDWAVVTRSAAQANWQMQVFPTTDGTVFARGLTLSAEGRFVVAGRQNASDGSENIVVRRGNLRNGHLGALETLDSRSAPADFSDIWGGTSGAVVVMWSQNNGSGTSEFASTLDTPDGNWAQRDTMIRLPSDSGFSAAVTDVGDFYWYSWSRCSTMARVAGTWLAEMTLPSGSCTNLRALPAVARNGNALLVTDANGLWQTIDAARRELIDDWITQPRGPSGFVLGTSWRSLPGSVVLSVNGQGAVISINAYDTLPTAAAPLGDSRGNSINNLWGLYFK